MNVLSTFAIKTCLFNESVVQSTLFHCSDSTLGVKVESPALCSRINTSLSFKDAYLNINIPMEEQSR